MSGALTSAQPVSQVPINALDNPIMAQINAEIRNQRATEATTKAFDEFVEKTQKMCHTMAEETSVLRKSLIDAKQQKRKLTKLHEADAKASKIHLEELKKENEDLKKANTALLSSNQSLTNDVASLNSTVTSLNSTVTRYRNRLKQVDPCFIQ